MSKSEPVTVKLEYPFQFTDDELVSEVTIPRITAGQMRGINIKRLESETDEMFKLIEKLIGRGARFIDKMDFVDVQKIMEVVSGFLESSPKTGKNG